MKEPLVNHRGGVFNTSEAGSIRCVPFTHTHTHAHTHTHIHTYTHTHTHVISSHSGDSDIAYGALGYWRARACLYSTQLPFLCVTFVIKSE